MHLVIDIGNSFIKTAEFKGKKMISLAKSPLKNFNVPMLTAKGKTYQSAIISSVIGEHPELDEYLLKVSHKLIHFGKNTSIPLKNLYKTPETLGKDRLAMAAGAAMMFPGKNVLIVDAGTCLTFDFVSQNSEYQGGSIHPGLMMRFKSLNSFTARLPLIRFQEDYFRLTGQSTEESILSGVQYGMVAEINSVISDYKKHYGKVKIILTGGDSAYLSKYLKSPIIADNFFLLKCLYKILLFNA